VLKIVQHTTCKNVKGMLLYLFVDSETGNEVHLRIAP